MTEMFKTKNPWQDQNRPLKEFLWDMEHFTDDYLPSLWAGLRGRNAYLDPQWRFFAFCMIGAAAFQIIGAVCILIVAYYR